MRRLPLVLLGLLLFGLARLPFERQLTAELRAAHFFESNLTRNVREQGTQMEFAAALSGFRSVVGDIMWLRCYSTWAQTDWGKLKVRLDAATTLQPRNLLFWDNASWHMAWNASVAMMQNQKQPRETLRLKAAREYIRLGEEFLLRGIQFNPDRARLYELLGNLYREKMNDPCRAADAYLEAARRPDHTAYVYRMGLYEMAKCPGRETEAYRLILAAYQNPKNRLPSLLVTLDRLQKALNVPAAEQIDITQDLKDATPGRRAPAPKQ